eukprot:CAMPEP_0183602826 /NCGR_PEP_ID=MMETSP0371-20130417/181140_1 /TAXON_ID=268820 /ORGANISM="Peridinium aciculiferum, Strain PAER-2" /LENGTH=442 /DNA_ID=CAMNT_0025814923 /DNA_START=9 /DNA_END=1337 /DNA_ORIENTATION=-
MMSWADMADMEEVEDMDLGAELALRVWNSREALAEFNHASDSEHSTVDQPHDSEISTDISTVPTTEDDAYGSESSFDKAASEATTHHPGWDAPAELAVTQKNKRVQSKALTKEMTDVEASSPATPLERHGKGSATPTALGKFERGDAHKPGSGLLSARATPTSNASSEEAQLEELRSMVPLDAEEKPTSIGTMKHEAAQLEELKSMVPLDAEGKPTSIGTMKHEAGLCKPCVFFPSDIGCSNGISCLFCHITHARAQRHLCKTKRERYKKLIESQVAFRLNGQQDVPLSPSQAVDVDVCNQFGESPYQEEEYLQDVLAFATEAQLEELRSMVPLDAEEKPTSIGTMKHEAGLCKPCVFFPSEIGCSKGITCLYCHMTHTRALRRLCRSKRERYKRLIESQLAFHLNGQQDVASLAFAAVDVDVFNELGESPYQEEDDIFKTF